MNELTQRNGYHDPRQAHQNEETPPAPASVEYDAIDREFYVEGGGDA